VLLEISIINQSTEVESIRDTPRCMEEVVREVQDFSFVKGCNTFHKLVHRHDNDKKLAGRDCTGGNPTDRGGEDLQQKYQ
jgi:hypothetical protein